MIHYILKRLLLVIPTLLVILTINFFVIQLCPGGPVEQMLARIQGTERSVLERTGGSTQDEIRVVQSSLDNMGSYRGADGLDPELVDRIRKFYGFDRPILERYWNMLADFARFRFGDSLFRDKSILELVREKLPVSLSLGLWTTLISYVISIPLGIRKSIRAGTPFDAWTSFAVVAASAVPTFLFAIALVILFAGGSYWNVFPLRGLVSPDFESLDTMGKIADYAWHMALPVLSMVIGSFAGTTLLTRNCFLDEIGRQYVVAARARGLTESRVLYGHVFRNAMLIFIAGFPGAFIGMFFTGSLLIEVIFSLDGLGQMGFEATMQRDYPLMFATLYISTLLGLVVKVVSDLTYSLVDPRIDFQSVNQ
ncbi:microcin C transport system permease protein [Desulfobaculum xiamenense]|uniref:Microcin C transport system permease protein n=1 Tax=Desulfobaculum xiamenense TaxID=995050 RepID=A0A846QI87_9BACT|nr:microcin C ABC transporter permease YejB [Desulfobaculum xiamenense]NJB67901.1 microcin C transport system permease protein [Desulfobaculum xiamenense]